MTSTDYRLPRDVLPTDYAIDLDASPKRSAFSGTLVLTAKVKKVTDTIELHAKDLTVSDVRLKAKGLRGQIGVKIKKHPDRETVALIFDRQLPKGEIQVTMAFRGKLSHAMNGLYLAQDGADRAVVSQCEAPFARAIFPCFDEPDMKATLCWTVRTDPNWVVITNGVAESSTLHKASGRRIHRFKRTRIIPTYLAAVTIGAYESSDVRKVAGIPCRSWSGPGKVDQTAFAQEVTAHVLPWYQNYFGQKYNYQKLDQVAVPGFDAGAMENVGAIFYRQNLLLMQPGATSWAAQKRIAEVIAHEIAHQWFGNLVTMRWWDDLWLNEAFATWIAFKAVDLWKPEWRLWDDYLESKESALAADALLNTHPIYSEVKSPAEATELFDVITYEKGCAVLRMIESYLGDAVFREGIRRYQSVFRNKNARGADLWNALTDASEQPVDALMGSWVMQPGFPLVHVELQHGTGAHAGTTVHVTQRRYFANAHEMARGDQSQVWITPMIMRHGTGSASAAAVQEHRCLLTESSDAFQLPAAKWVYPNANSTGFYRVHMEGNTLAALLTHGLQHLNPAERKSLLEDQWALVRAGLTHIEQFMDVVSAFANERDHVVIRSLVGLLGYLDQRIVSDDDRPLLQQFVRTMFAPHLADLGWDSAPNEPAARSVCRAAVLRALGDIGRNEDVLREAELRTQQEMGAPASIDANVAGTIVALGAIRGTRQQLKTYVDTYLDRKKNRATPDLQSRYLNALSAFEHDDVTAQIHALCLGDTVPQEQLRVVLQPMLGNRASQKATWLFLKKNWKELAPRIGSMGIGRLVEATGSLPSAMQQDVVGFFQKNPVEEAKRALQKALEAMAIREELCARESTRLGAWLRQRTATARRASGS